jgi:hypothetical protein
MRSTKDTPSDSALVPADREGKQGGDGGAPPGCHPLRQGSLSTAPTDDVRFKPGAPDQSSWMATTTRWVLKQFILGFAAYAEALHPELSWHRDDQADHSEAEQEWPRRLPPRK